MRRLALVCTLALGLGACQGVGVTEPEEVAPTATGLWSGIGASGFVFFDLVLALNEAESGRLSGTGRLSPVATTSGLPTFNFVVRAGAHGHPDVLLSLATADRVDVNYSGRFVEDHKIEGLINGSGFNNLPVTLTRKVTP